MSFMRKNVFLTIDFLITLNGIHAVREIYVNKILVNDRAADKVAMAKNV